jgi:hypothetical protein
MAAEIYPFPKRQPNLAIVKSIDLQHCWDRRLQNPFLNSLYKSEVSYAERWYLQVVHQLNFEESHPLVNTLLNPKDYTLNLLLDCVNKDLKIHLNVLNHDRLLSHYAMVADYNVRRLNKWKLKWECLIKHRDLQSYKT